MNDSMIINVVHLHVHHEEYHTGIDRYLEMYAKGIEKDVRYSNVKMHKLYVVDDKGLVFPEIKVSDDNTVSVLVPMFYSAALVSVDNFWNRRSMGVVADMVMPYFQDMANLIFQSHNLFLSILAMELKDRLGGSVLTHLHCLPWKFAYNESIEKYNKLHSLYSARRYKEFNDEEKSKVDYMSSDKIICLSNAAKQYLINTKYVEEDKVVIIRNGLAQDTLDRNRNEDRIRILYVGKTSKDKGTFGMLDALKMVKKRGYKFEVIIAGAISPVDEESVSIKYGDMNIAFLHQIPYQELKKLYCTCTLGVIPSIHEQCSYVAIEMSMFGLPMVVSDVDALGEMFIHERTALKTPLLFDEDFGLEFDTEMFASNIIRLIEDKELRMNLSMNVRKEYEKSFSLSEMIDNTVNIYRQII